MLGRVYQQMEKKNEAIEAYDRFLQLNMSGPQANQARAALEQLQAS
jgi:regulator of sirC expression with transglutaminase-like and TPR domain